MGRAMAMTRSRLPGAASTSATRSVPVRGVSASHPAAEATKHLAVAKEQIGGEIGRHRLRWQLPRRRRNHMVDVRRHQHLGPFPARRIDDQLDDTSIDPQLKEMPRKGWTSVTTFPAAEVFGEPHREGGDAERRVRPDVGNTAELTT